MKGNSSYLSIKIKVWLYCHALYNMKEPDAKIILYNIIYISCSIALPTSNYFSKNLQTKITREQIRS